VFEPDAIDELADLAFEANAEMENIGARRLQTVMSRLLNEILFDVPDKIPPGSLVRIDAARVREKLSGLIKNKNLSEYIL
jgi:ATP-dependent HslUV protease ATP-binding subunit HslU